jgi:diguanylate cyclase (GGDEF)-like protein
MKKLRLLFKNLSIHYRLLWAYSLTFLLILSLSSFLIYSVVRTTIERNIEKELKNSTHSILSMVKTAIDASIRNHLRAIAENNRDIITDLYNKANDGLMSTQAAKDLAKQILLSQSIGKSGYIYCINHDGIIQVHPKEGLIGTDLSKNDFISVQKEKKVGYIEYNWANPGETVKRPKALYMTYFAPWDWIISVSSYREEFKELLSVEDFKQNILSITFGKTGYPYIMDSKGLLVIHPKLSGTNIYNSKDENGRMFIREICEQKNGKIIYPWKNPDEQKARKKLVIFNYIPELDWIVASSSYLEEFYQPLTTIAYSIGATVLIMLILIIPITWLISSRLAMPLQEMINVFETGSRSGFTSRLDVKWGGEMGEVAKNYNRFIGTLETTRQQLEKSRDELEKRVEERTRELSSWIQELEQRNSEDALLRKMSEMVQVCNTTEEIYGVMQHYFSLFFPDTAGCLHIYEKEIQHLKPVVFWGDSAYRSAPFLSEECWALRQGKPYLAQTELTSPLCSHLEGFPGDESLCAPLMVREEVLGLLHILVSRTSSHSSGTVKQSVLESKQGLAIIIAEHLSLALVNIRLRENLRRQSILDPLTGLYNRRFLNESLKREAHSMKRHNYSIGILMIDVDHFKKFNDTYGHECGDTVLRDLGRFLQDNTRGDDIVCRYGGEEFVLILSKAGWDQTLIKAQNLCLSIREDLKVFWQDTTHNITVSVGASLCSPGQSLEKSLNKADNALYLAKTQGRDQVAWENDLLKAPDSKKKQ